ncbi:MAG TPA: HD domain-containing protein [Candidatus Acidoferrales bacterium]|nr:HD domain-containing protein [Candidatus Acidoferrales bacterium]
MKPAYVADLVPDQTITSFFLVVEKEIRSTREGKSYLRLELGDRTGTVESRMWDRFEESTAGIVRDDFVKVQARVETYRNKLQLMLDRVRKAESAEVDLEDFYSHTEANVDELWGRLREHAAGVNNPWLRQLLDSVLDDPEISPRLRLAPAAKSMHHAYLGGLIEHVVSLCELASVVAARYPEANRDLLITGAVLHDIGKVYELSYDRSLGYTTEGQLVGHIVMAVEIVGRKAGAIQGFPDELATLVKHMILSHHGQYDFGSPKLPMFREAVMLHYLDDLDSKMGAMRVMLSSDKGDPDWTERGAALERRLLRVDHYLPAEPIAADPEQLRLDPPPEKPAGKAAGKKASQ